MFFLLRLFFVIWKKGVVFKKGKKEDSTAERYARCRSVVPLLTYLFRMNKRIVDGGISDYFRLTQILRP